MIAYCQDNDAKIPPWAEKVLADEGGLALMNRLDWTDQWGTSGPEGG